MQTHNLKKIRLYGKAQLSTGNSTQQPEAARAGQRPKNRYYCSSAEYLIASDSFESNGLTLAYEL